IRDMSSAYGTGGTAGAAAATPFGLSVFAEIASARQTSRQVTGAFTAGGTLVQDVAACTNLGAVDATAAASALQSGVFAVRGGSSDSQAAALNKPDAFPRWGVESKTSTWPTSTAVPRYLILGVAGAPPVEPGGEPEAVVGFVGYDVSSLPSTLAKGGLRVGLCVKTTTSDLGAGNRLIHGGVVEANSPPTFCD